MKTHCRPPLRIVSLAPSATSILCAIGAKLFLVGVTKWCDAVAPVGKLPKLGDCWHMDSVDEIVRLKPTLVIGSVPYKQETVARLLEQPFPFLAMNPRNLSGIYADILLLGDITHRSAAAEKLVAKMRRAFSRTEKTARRFKKRVRVYCEAWPNPRISSPPWVAELVSICGGKMVVPAGDKITEAQVAAANPELIVLAWAATGAKSDPEQAYKITEWKGVPAIRNRQVYVISDELLNTPGPPLVEGAHALFKLFPSANRMRERR
jgi:iron complex transport system substrate-binding protein